MGIFTSFALLSALYIVVGWVIYRVFLSRSNQPAFNRLFIMIVMLFPVVWVPTSLWIATLMKQNGATPGGGVAEPLWELIPSGPGAPDCPLWARITVGVYFAGVIVTAFLAILSLVRILMIIRRAENSPSGQYPLLLTREEGMMPFSWGGYIVIPVAEQTADTEMILSHEFAHMRHRHWVDLLISQVICVFQWFNPAAWALRRDLALIHEYQADAEVIAEGRDEKEYQRLLLHRVMDNKTERLLANNLNTNNLKKRIAMMKKEKSRPRARYISLALVPALALVFGLTRTSAYAALTSATSAVTISALSGTSEEPEEKDGEKVYYTVETQAEFPGGMRALMAWMKANLKFPDALEKQGISGRVIVRFQVGADGKVSNPKIMKGLCPEADEEALRVVSDMPDWTPATVAGKPVNSWFTIPVSFNLEQEKSEKSEKKVAYFVNDKPFNGDLNKLDPSSIESIKVVKNDPEYPDGRIDITLK